MIKNRSMQFVRTRTNTLVQLCVIGYVLFLQPTVFTSGLSVMDEHSTAPWLSFLIIAVLVLELVAIAFTTRQAFADGAVLHDHTRLLGVWLFHLIPGLLLGTTAIIGLGIDFTDFDTNSSASALAAVLIGLVVLRELVILGLLLHDKRRAPITPWQEVLVLVGIAAFGSLAYTMAWETMASLGSGLARYDGAEKILQGVVAGVVFLMMYVPMQLGLMVGKRYKRPLHERLGDWIGIGLVATLAVAALWNV